MENIPKWKTTVMALLGAIFVILKVIVPEVFDVETIDTLLKAIDVIIVSVLSIIAAVSARDTIDKKNLW